MAPGSFVIPAVALGRHDGLDERIYTFHITGSNALPHGDYIVREAATNNSMLKTFTEEIHATVDEDGKVLSFTARNAVVRGGISIKKRDSQTAPATRGTTW